MKELKERVKKELTQIGEKGLTSSNLDTTYKLIDIYKDITEIDKNEKGGEDKMYYDRYNEDYGARGQGGRYRDNYGHYPREDRFDRYFNRMRDGIDDYNAGRSRYREGGSNERMIDGIEMTMGAIVTFIESLMDMAETPQEKEIVHKYIEKIKKY